MLKKGNSSAVRRDVQEQAAPYAGINQPAPSPMAELLRADTAKSKNRLTKLQKNGKLEKTITGMETELDE